MKLNDDSSKNLIFEASNYLESWSTCFMVYANIINEIIIIIEFYLFVMVNLS